MNLSNFKQIQDYDNYFINRDGDIWNNKEKKFLKVSYSSKYCSVSINSTNVNVHRILAIAFLDKPEHLKNYSFKDLDVNHIDGNKFNYKLSNLEWTTRKENCLHAYRTGLRTDNKPVLVKDLRDNSIKKFYSIEECARYFRVSGSIIRLRLNNIIKSKIWFNFFQVILEGDEWPEVDENLIGKYSNGSPKPVIAISNTDAPSLIFESAGTCAAYFKVKAATLISWIRLNIKSSITDWSFKYIDDPTLIDRNKIIKREKIIKTTYYKKPSIPIKVFDMQLNSTQIYNSCAEFAGLLSINVNTLQKHIWRTKGIYKHYKIEYLINN